LRVIKVGDIPAVTLPVIQSLNIEYKLGAFQMDNASNNDTALEALATDIPGLDVRQQRLMTACSYVR
jgi:hypothetical protein